MTTYLTLKERFTHCIYMCCVLEPTYSDPDKAFKVSEAFKDRDGKALEKRNRKIGAGEGFFSKAIVFLEKKLGKKYVVWNMFLYNDK